MAYFWKLLNLIESVEVWTELAVGHKIAAAIVVLYNMRQGLTCRRHLGPAWLEHVTGDEIRIRKHLTHCHWASKFKNLLARNENNQPGP